MLVKEGSQCDRDTKENEWFARTRTSMLTFNLWTLINLFNLCLHGSTFRTSPTWINVLPLCLVTLPLCSWPGKTCHGFKTNPINHIYNCEKHTYSDETKFYITDCNLWRTLYLLVSNSIKFEQNEIHIIRTYTYNLTAHKKNMRPNSALNAGVINTNGARTQWGSYSSVAFLSKLATSNLDFSRAVRSHIN